MATNITSEQATAAASALISQQSVGGLPSPIRAGPSSSSVNRSTSNIMTTTSNSQTRHTNLRTDELILAELQKLSARMTQVEQELHTDTFASTPRKRKRTGPNRQASDSSIFGAVNRTGAYASVDESAVQPRNPGSNPSTCSFQQHDQYHHIQPVRPGPPSKCTARKYGYKHTNCLLHVSYFESHSPGTNST